MPLDEEVLGFSNRWYPAAMESATTMALSPDQMVRVVTVPYFIATKLEAFKGRGRGDFLGSHDMEDLIFVVDRRPALPHEAAEEPYELRQFLASEVQALLSNPKFIDALPGYLAPDEASQSRLEIILRRLKTLGTCERASVA